MKIYMTDSIGFHFVKFMLCDSHYDLSYNVNGRNLHLDLYRSTISSEIHIIGKLDSYQSLQFNVCRGTFELDQPLFFNTSLPREQG